MTMRHLIDLLESSETDDTPLADLKRQLADAMAQWQTIQTNKPDPETSGWWNRPDGGGFWNRRIYPLNQEIERLEAEAKHLRRTHALLDRSKVGGFDTSEILYHGSNVEFEAFDRSKVRTASHLYTSPDLDTAKAYGDHVYAVFGRQQPQADLTAETGDFRLVCRIHRHGFRRAYDLSQKALAELIFDGQLYQYTSNSGLQDDVVSTCFSLKFRSVRLSDGIPGGHGFSDSVIFEHASDLQIVEKLS